MQTHEDAQHKTSFIERLRERADAAEKAKASVITSGAHGEKALAEWKSGGISVRHMPDDEQGILRISIGGGKTPVPVEYCVFRGDLGQCIALLERAIVALRAAP